MKSKILVKNNGFTGTDIMIAIIIFITFISIILTSFYNYYASIQSKNRLAIATNIIVDIIENVETMNYDDITQDSVNTLVKNLKDDGTIQTQYDVIATISKYNEQNGNEHKMDLIKILKVKVEYESNTKKENFEITRLITK